MSLPTPFTFSAINCNSLNMASSLQNIQVRKLYGIVKLRTDIIFLSDVRIKCKNLVSNSENIEKIFRINPYRSYNFFFNSSQNRRGVGILIANNVKFREIERVIDPDENFLLMRIEIAGNEIIIGAVYGLNQTDKNFFMRLRDGLKKARGFSDLPGWGLECYA